MSDYSRMSREQLLAELAKKDDLMWERSVIDGKQIDAARAELAAERERAERLETDRREAVEAAEERRIAVMAKEIAELRARPDALRADKAEAERDTLRELLREVRPYVDEAARARGDNIAADHAADFLTRIDTLLADGAKENDDAPA